jgi:nicotinate phosphoribosyltransferase
MDDASLLVDLYELTMAASYHARGLDTRATFELSVRSLRPGRTFLVCAGLESALAWLEQLRFDDDAVAYLRSLELFTDDFLAYLGKLRFTGDVHAVPEGQVVFAGEPLLRITGPRIQAQLAETFVLNAYGHATATASKAARILLAAGGRPVVDFSARRNQGSDAALTAARSSWIAGWAGTSNVLAGKRFGIPVYGTMAHSYVLSFRDELDAFLAYAQDFPQSCLLLIDTYDVEAGARRAVEVAEAGHHVRAVRIDSGDLAALAVRVRTILDAAGLHETGIFLSGDLDEYGIRDLLAAGAPATAFGVGTELAAPSDAPALGAIYKLVDDEQGAKAKLSTGKSTAPGVKQVRRVDGDRDVVALDGEAAPGRPLLEPVMQDGRRLEPPESLDAARERAARAVAALPSRLREIRDPGDEPEPYPIEQSAGLHALRDTM